MYFFGAYRTQEEGTWLSRGRRVWGGCVREMQVFSKSPKQVLKVA